MSGCVEEDAVSIVSATTQNSYDKQTDVLMVKPKEMNQEDVYTDLVLEVDGQLSDFVTPASPILPVYNESQAQVATYESQPLNNSLCDPDDDVGSGDDCSQMSEVLIPLKQTAMNTEHSTLFEVQSTPNKQGQDTDTVEPSQSLLPLTVENEQMHNRSINEVDGQHQTSFTTPIHAAGTETVNVGGKMKTLDEEIGKTTDSCVEHGAAEHLSTESKHREQLHLGKANFEQHDLRRKEQTTHTYRTRSLIQPQSERYKKRKYNMYSDCSDSCCAVEQKKSKASCTRVNLNSCGRTVKQSKRTSDPEGQVSFQFAVDRNSDEVNLRIGKLLNTIDKLPDRQQEVVKTTVEHCIVKLQDNLEKGLSQTLNITDQLSYFRLRKLVQVIQSNLTRVMCFYKRCEKDGSITHGQPCLFDMHVQHKKNLLSIVQRQKTLVKQFKAIDRDKPAAHVSNTPRHNKRMMGPAPEMFTTVDMKPHTGVQKDLFDITDEVNARASFDGDKAKYRKSSTKVVKDFNHTEPVKTSLKSQIRSGIDILIESDNTSIDPGLGKQSHVLGVDDVHLPDTAGTKSELLWLNMLHGEENKEKHSQTSKVHIAETMRSNRKPDRQDLPGVDRGTNDGVNSDDMLDGQLDDGDYDNISDNESIDILTATKVTHCTPNLHENLATCEDRQINTVNISIDSYRSNGEKHFLEDNNSSTENVIDQDSLGENYMERDRQRHTLRKDSTPTNDQFNGENNTLDLEQRRESLLRRSKKVDRLTENGNGRISKYCKEIGEKAGQEVKHIKFLSSSSQCDAQPLKGQTSPPSCASSDVFPTKTKSLITQGKQGMQAENGHHMIPGQIDVDIEDLKLQDEESRLKCRQSQRPAHHSQHLCHPGDNLQLPPFEGTNVNEETNSQHEQDHGHSPTYISDTKLKISESQQILKAITIPRIKPQWSETSDSSLCRLEGHSPGPYHVVSGSSYSQLETHSIESQQVMSPLPQSCTTISNLRNNIDLYKTEGNSELNRKSDSLPSWKELIADNRVVPGHNVLSVQIKGSISYASLTQNGKIHDSRGLWFNSLAKWLSSLMGGQTIKKNKAYELVMYKGKTIQAICRTQNDTLTAVKVDKMTKISERNNSSQHDQITQTEFLDAIKTDTRVLNTYDRHLNDMLSSSTIHLMTKKDFVSCEDLPNDFWFEDFAKVKLYKSIWNSVTCW